MAFHATCGLPNLLVSVSDNRRYPEPLFGHILLPLLVPPDFHLCGAALEVFPAPGVTEQPPMVVAFDVFAGRNQVPDHWPALSPEGAPALPEGATCLVPEA